jgi:hypothetical protein
MSQWSPLQNCEPPLGPVEKKIRILHILGIQQITPKRIFPVHYFPYHSSSINNYQTSKIPRVCNALPLSHVILNDFAPSLPKESLPYGVHFIMMSICQSVKAIMYVGLLLKQEFTRIILPPEDINLLPIRINSFNLYTHSSLYTQPCLLHK